MRCPTCGTENAPDSRFCGGCGARLTPQEQKLAPTHKILDDSPYPAQPASTPPSKPPVSFAPPSMPPTSSAAHTSNRPASIPPASRVAVDSMAESIAIPARRPMGLIALVLVIDLGLAIAGAFLLMKGLSKDDKPAKTSAAAMNAPVAATPAASPAAAAKNSDVGVAGANVANAGAVTDATAGMAGAKTSPSTDAKAGAKTTPSTDAKAGAKTTPSTDAKGGVKTDAKTSTTTGAKTDPTSSTSTGAKTDPTSSTSTGAKTDPTSSTSTDGKTGTKTDGKTGTKTDGKTGTKTDPKSAKTDAKGAARTGATTHGDGDPFAVNYDGEIAQHTDASRAALDACAPAGTVHGTIEIVFEIQADGSVTRAGAGSNSTGNGEVARCLANVIDHWKLSPHQGASTQFVKSFSYP